MYTNHITYRQECAAYWYTETIRYRGLGDLLNAAACQRRAAGWSAEARELMGTEFLPPSTFVDFNYEHGGFQSKNHRDMTGNWLAKMEVTAVKRDGGVLYHIYLPDLGGDFWPEDASEEAWKNAY